VDQTFPFIPWGESAQWSAANASIEHSLQRHRHALTPSRQLAHELRVELNILFHPMEALCQTTCPFCNDICCRRACVWIDFKDLLFLHLADIQPPSQQLLAERGERCRYSGPAGCRLERIGRPFVCTWYLCPAQTARLLKIPDQKKRIADSLQRIKYLRNEMETAFIQVVA